MGAVACQITSLTIVYSIVYSDAGQRKTSKCRVTGLCAGNSPGTGEFPAEMASNAEIVSSWRRHHVRVRKSDVSKLVITTITVTQAQRWCSSNWYEEIIDFGFILTTKVGIAGFKWIWWLIFIGSMTLIIASWQLILLWHHMSFRASEITKYSTIYLKAFSY